MILSGVQLRRQKRSYFLRAFLAAVRIFFTGAPMLKCSSFLPDFSAAAIHRGFSPRPAHVSVGFSGLRYFGATGPRVPPRTPLTRNPLAVRRESLASWSCTARRSSITFELRAASTWSLNFDNLSIDIDLRFMGALPALCLFHLGRDCRENQLHYGR